MALSKNFARALLRMLREEKVTGSEITARGRLNQFLEDGIIRKIPAGKGRYTYEVPDAQALHHYLQLHYQIRSLENYLHLFNRQEVSGQEALQAGTSTKIRRSPQVRGFLANTTRRLEVVYKGQQLRFPAPAGSGVFLFYPDQLQLPPHIPVVGIENPEMFAKIHEVAHYFHNRQPCLFVSRYLSKGLISWLKGIPNTYIHFGDFDLSGLAIYLQEYRRHIGPARSEFFIPEDIEQRISHKGNAQIYRVQEQHTRNIAFEQYPEIAHLARLIKKYRKGLEQEALLFTEL